jgi:hypothetical protein
MRKEMTEKQQHRIYRAVNSFLKFGRIIKWSKKDASAEKRQVLYMVGNRENMTDPKNNRAGKLSLSS